MGSKGLKYWELKKKVFNNNQLIFKIQTRHLTRVCQECVKSVSFYQISLDSEKQVSKHHSCQN